MVQTKKNLVDEREPIVDDTQQLPDDFDQSEIYQEYLRRSKLRSDDLPRADRSK